MENANEKLKPKIKVIDTNIKAFVIILSICLEVSAIDYRFSLETTVKVL